MTRELTPQERILVALAEKFRADGEFWYGDPSDATFNVCANMLLQALGLKDEDRRQIGFEEKYTLLASVGIEFNVRDGRTAATSEMDPIIEDLQLEPLYELTNPWDYKREEVSDEVMGRKVRPHLWNMIREIGRLRAALDDAQFVLKKMREDGKGVHKPASVQDIMGAERGNPKTTEGVS